MDNLNRYEVFVNGNEFVFADSNKKPCLRRCLSLARKKTCYVELWYVHGNGSRVLVSYWN